MEELEDFADELEEAYKKKLRQEFLQSNDLSLHTETLDMSVSEEQDREKAADEIPDCYQ